MPIPARSAFLVGTAPAGFDAETARDRSKIPLIAGIWLAALLVSMVLSLLYPIAVDQMGLLMILS